MASTAQINWATTLATEVFAGKPELLMQSISDLAPMTNAQFTKRIDWLKGLKKLAATPVKAVPAGTYLVMGQIVKVKIAKKSGAPYLIAEDGTYLGALKGDAPAMLAAIEADPKGCAIAYGKATGNCCICSKTLTNPASIEAGIGPVCASKF
jgi:hypothetical protein